ncbi:MAG: RNA-guided endonuclease TnpB family protein [Nanoarchaeota archaeon]
MKSTIKIKLPYRKELLETMQQYSYSANKVIDFGWNIQTDNKRELHDLTYYRIREETDLPAQLVCSSRDKAVEVLKATKFKHSKPIMKKYLTIRYDARSFTLKNTKEEYYVSLSTIYGRIKIPIDIPEYYWKYLDWKICSADLIYSKGLYLYLVFSRDIITTKISDGFLGVDVGINNVAVTSDKRFFNSKQIKRKKLMFKYLRSKLQSKGTRSSRRLLKKISGRENRWMTWVNHKISKEIVKCREGTIVIENIRGIRSNKGRRFNFWLHSWSFAQLQAFIEYKGIMNGKRIIKVSPYHTSKSCSICGNIGSRSKSFFVCSHCGYSLNADLNASFNLAKHHSISDGVLVPVTVPDIQVYEHKGSSSAIACEPMDKIYLL